jgi:S-DNA-T family DNA segregation ATPase FtsK/SpoIIIE
MDVVVVAGPDAGRRIPLTSAGVVVGRSAGLGLSVRDEQLSRRHARITLSDNGFGLTDLRSTNGTRCGSRALPEGGAVDIDGAELIAVGNTLLRLERAVGPTAPTLPRGDGHVAANRSPRTRPPEPAVTVSAPAPPTPPRRGRIPWVAAALPVPFAALLATFFGPQMLAFALLSPLMLIGNVLGDRWGGRREYSKELAAHRTELCVLRDEFEAARGLERERRWRETPDPAAVLDIATGPGTRLWERRRGAPDAGRVRLGVGNLPTRTRWAPHGANRVDRAAHSVDDGEDALRAVTLPHLPVEVGLEQVGGLGIAGPPGEVEAVMRHVLGQVVTLHSPRDVHLVVRVPEGDGDGPLSWARWLPHTTAYGDLDTCLDALRDVVTTREAEQERGGSSQPRVLLVLPASEDDLGVGELDDLVGRGRQVGVWCLVGAGTAGALPSSCHAVLGLGVGGGGHAARLDVDGCEPVPSFMPDQVGWWWGERLGRALAALVDVSGEAPALPETVELLDLLPWLDEAALTPEALAAHWACVGLPPHLRGRPVARMGRLAEEDWTIDLATDGPHVLVGGTTGSGKSELLRTLVTSLALQCSPEDLTFVLVDYKGGSAFGECADLPHTVGLVTNLDEGLARRALTSLGAEITRREGLLARSGARDHDDHRRREGGLPRLVIVIDEFRLLADELPDFVDGVVALAAVGRSLGVHLVLATQRPAGAITADIQANVNLRIAMRVRDAADSTDVIGSADAARIRADLPGRGLARGGDGQLVEFQAARVGTGSAAASTRVTVLDALGRPTNRSSPKAAPTTSLAPTDGDLTTSGLGSLAATTRRAAALSGLAPAHRPWLPPLPDVLDAHDVSVPAVGLLDLPAQQCQDELRHDCSPGHWLVVGGPQSGRTSTLRTILASHVGQPGSPVHAYVIDTSGELGDLESLPHVGAVVRADDVSRVRRLLELLRARTRRDASVPGSPPPPVLLLVDGWERLEPDGDLLVGGVRDELLDVLRAGDVGLRAVLTGDRSALSSRLSTVSSETFLLPLADPTDATYAGLSRRDLPSSRAPGRGLRLRDRVEVQFALRDPVAEVAPRAPGAPEPRQLPQLPDVVDHCLLPALGTEQVGVRGTDGAPPSPPLPLGLRADTGSVAGLDPTIHGRRILVTGHAGSGRSMTLTAIGLSAVRAGLPVAVVEGRGGGVGRCVGADTVVDPWQAQELVEAKRRHPHLVVLVDDAERLDRTPVEPVLLEILALVDRDDGLVVASATLTAVASAFRGVVHDVAREQSGVLLGPRTPGDGEAFAIRAPRGLRPVPGRALLVSGRQHSEIQVARVPHSPRGRA